MPKSLALCFQRYAKLANPHGKRLELQPNHWRRPVPNSSAKNSRVELEAMEANFQ